MRRAAIIVLLMGICLAPTASGQRARISKEVCERSSSNPDYNRGSSANTAAINIEALSSHITQLPNLLERSEQVPHGAKDNSRFLDNIFNLLNMAGTAESARFHPMNQAQRNQLYLKTMVNPLGFAKVAFSAGVDQANDKPTEWEQGMSGYGKRYANILGQYSIQRTVTFALGSALHEDNRYFNSGKHGFWRRTGYALSSSILARHDDGSRHFSISQVSGVLSGAFLARTWLPASQSSVADAAESFGISTASNAGFSVLKEFLPDLVHRVLRKRVPPTRQNPGE